VTLTQEEKEKNDGNGDLKTIFTLLLCTYKHNQTIMKGTHMKEE
jgi:hypothetical protein